MSYSAAEADRRLANVIDIGVVVSVSADRVAVQLGDVTTPMVPVMHLRAGGIAFYWMPEVGEQVLVACPSGDVARAVVLGGIFKGNAPGSNPAEPVIELQGGRMHLRGTLIVTDDVIANDISLVHHVHGEVVKGFAKTGEPE